MLTAVIDMAVHKLRDHAGVEDHNLAIFDRPTEASKDDSAGEATVPTTANNHPDNMALNVEGGGYEGGGLADMELEFDSGSSPCREKIQETPADPAAADAVAPRAAGPLAVTIADDAAADNEEGNTAFAADAAEQQRLLTSAMLTGVAIILHNIPEGLATFVVSWLLMSTPT